jgi:hypothetical protein
MARNLGVESVVAVVLVTLVGLAIARAVSEYHRPNNDSSVLATFFDLRLTAP